MYNMAFYCHKMFQKALNVIKYKTNVSIVAMAKYNYS